MAQGFTGYTPLPLTTGNGGTSLTSLTAHAVMVGNGTSPVTLVGPSATPGQVLTSNGSSADPSFQLPSAASVVTVPGVNALFGTTLSASLRGFDSLVQCNVKSATTTAQPASPADGDAYLLPASPTGAAWTGNAGKIARYSTVAAAWEFYTPQNGWETYAQDTGIYWFRVAGAWTAQLKIGNGTASTSTSTGDLVVVGGGGFGGAVYAPQVVIASGVNQAPVTGGFAYGVGSGAEGIRFSLAVGSTYDLTIAKPDNSAYILQVPTGTQNGIWFGKWTLDGSSGKSLAYTNPTANGSVATTLGSVGPTGSTAGNPQGWLRVNVGGTDRFVPFW